MTTRADPVFRLDDGAARLPKELRAQTTEFTAEERAKLNSGRLGKFSQIVDRNRPIEVIRGEAPGAPRGLVAPPPARAEAPSGPMRRDAMDDLMTARGVITVGTPAPLERGRLPIPANAVVIPYADATLEKAGIARPTAPAAPMQASAANPPSDVKMAGLAGTTLPPVRMATAQVVPQLPAALPTEVVTPTTPGLTVPTPNPGGHSGVAAPFKRETVILSSPTIGKHRLKVAQVLISESVVVLVYEDDEDATIYEPPAGGPDQPSLTVEYGATKYECAYLGQSVNQPVLGQPGRQLLLVVLVRL